MLWWPAQARRTAWSESQENSRFAGIHTRRASVWTSYVLSQGDQWWNQLKNVLWNNLDARRVALAVNSREVGRARLCLRQKEWYRCCQELKQEKSCRYSHLWGDWKERPEWGTGRRRSGPNCKQNSLFCFLPFVLLPCPAIVFMNCFLISLFQHLPLWVISLFNVPFMEFILILSSIINFAVKICFSLLGAHFLLLLVYGTGWVTGVRRCAYVQS